MRENLNGMHELPSSMTLDLVLPWQCNAMHILCNRCSAGGGTEVIEDKTFGRLAGWKVGIQLK